MKLGHEKFNALVKKIRNDDGWFESFIELCKEYYIEHGAGGNLHIVLDDENIEDNNIWFCIGCACGANDDEGGDIGELMAWMTMKQREKVVSNYSLYSS